MLTLAVENIIFKLVTEKTAEGELALETAPDSYIQAGIQPLLEGVLQVGAIHHQWKNPSYDCRWPKTTHT